MAASWSGWSAPRWPRTAVRRPSAGGVLVVVADGAAWAGQLRYLDQVLVTRIAEELPAVTVREVRVSVSREPGAASLKTWAVRPVDVPGSGRLAAVVIGP